MAITKTWEIEGVNVLSNLFQLQNVVRSIQWKLTVQNDGENLTPPQIAEIHGGVTLSLPDQNSFLSFETLTQEQMIAWVKNELGDQVKKYEKDAEQHVINSLIGAAPETMVVEPRPLPWA